MKEINTIPSNRSLHEKAKKLKQIKKKGLKKFRYDDRTIIEYDPKLTSEDEIRRRLDNKIYSNGKLSVI